MNRTIIIAAAFLAAGATAASAQQGSANMSFFVTSTGSGKGGDLGGLEGADAHCQQLAAGGRRGRPHMARLSQSRKAPARSTRATGSAAGRGRTPRARWSRQSVDDLHGAEQRSRSRPRSTEKGEPVKGRGDNPNMHDILTGSQADGRAFTGADDMTCGNWTSSESQGAAMVGHHDRMGLRDDAALEVLEHLAPFARPERRLQPEGSAQHRRRRAVLLLRRELTVARVLGLSRRPDGPSRCVPLCCVGFGAYS